MRKPKNILPNIYMMFLIFYLLINIYPNKLGSLMLYLDLLLLKITKYHNTLINIISSSIIILSKYLYSVILKVY